MDLTTPSIGSKVFEINGHYFVSGLYWRTIGSATNPASERPKRLGRLVVSRAGKHVIEEAQKVAADAVVVRRLSESHPIQIGLGQSSDIKKLSKREVYSWPQFIFEALSSYRNESTLIDAVCVVYPSNNASGDYLLAIQNQGLIIPTSGDTFNSLENIKEIVSQVLSTGGFQVFAPRELEIPGAQELPDIEALKASLGNSIELSRVTQIAPDYRSLLLYGVLAGAVFWGVYIGYSAYQAEIDKARNLKAQANFEALMAKQGQDVLPVKPVIKINSPEAMLFACSSGFKSMRLNAGGWEYTQSICRSGGITTTYQRNGSQIKFLQSVYPSAAFEIDGEKATVDKEIQSEPRSIELDKLPDREQVINELNIFAQATGQTILIQIKDNLTQEKLPGRETREISSNEPVKIDWQMDLPFIESIKRFNVPATSLNAVMFAKNEDGTFKTTIQGTSYAKN